MLLFYLSLFLLILLFPLNAQIFQNKNDTSLNTLIPQIRIEQENLDSLRFVMNNQTGKLIYDIQNFQARLTYLGNSLEPDGRESNDTNLKRSCLLSPRKIQFLQKHAIQNSFEIQFTSYAVVNNIVIAFDRDLHLYVISIQSYPLQMKMEASYPVNLAERLDLGVNFSFQRNFSRLIAYEQFNAVFFITEKKAFIISEFNQKFQIKDLPNFKSRFIYNAYIQQDQLIVAAGLDGIDVYDIVDNELFSHKNYLGSELFSFLGVKSVFDITDVQLEENMLFVLDIHWGLAIFRLKPDEKLERVSMHIPPQYDGRMMNIKQLEQRIVFISEEYDISTYYLHEIFIDTGAETFFFNHEIQVGLRYDEIHLNNDIAVIISSRIHFGFFHGTFNQFLNNDYRLIGIHFNSDIETLQPARVKSPGKPMNLYVSRAAKALKLVQIQYYPFEVLCLAPEDMPPGNIYYQLEMNSTRCSQERHHFNFFKKCEISQNITIVNADVVQKGSTVFSESEFRQIVIIVSAVFTLLLVVSCLIFFACRKNQEKADQMEVELQNLKTKYNKLTGVADENDTDQSET